MLVGAVTSLRMQSNRVSIEMRFITQQSEQRVVFFPFPSFFADYNRRIQQVFHAQELDQNNSQGVSPWSQGRVLVCRDASATSLV
jgi:hypothetical protein